MVYHEEFGKTWDLDENPKKGQLGLLRENHYRKLFEPAYRVSSFEPGDIWLDVGANIGSFAIRAAEFVKQVIAFEPEPNNAARLKKNIDLNRIQNIWVVESAIVGSHVPQVSLALSNTFSSTHRVGTIRGRRSIAVPALNINDVVYDTQTNKIKIDCEGTEAEILEVLKLDCIDELVFEYHFAMLKDTDWTRFYAIMQRLELEGFTFLRQPKEKSNTWHTIVWAKRL